MTIPVIRGTSRADLLSLPVIMLGFHPHDSCVVMALKGPSVRFCARVDLDWFAQHFDRVADQVLRCAEEAGADGFVFIGYGDPDVAAIAVHEFIDLVGASRVLDALVADGECYWSMLEPGEPTAYRFDTSAVAAQAVFGGVNLHPDRDSAIAPVTLCEPPAEQAVLEAESAAARLGEEGSMIRLRQLAEGPDTLTETEAVTLAVLLADEDRMGAVLCRLDPDTAEGFWARLVAVRRVCPARYEPNVLALLAAASWLSGRGAAHTSCLQQLSEVDPCHPLLLTLMRLHADGVPPSRWKG